MKKIVLLFFMVLFVSCHGDFVELSDKYVYCEYTIAEAMLWYQVGDGTQINVDASKLKLKRLNVSDYVVGKQDSYQCFTIRDALNGDNEALVYGKIYVTRMKDNSFKIGTDKYDFNIETEDLWTKRKLGTVIADVLHGAGTPFNINFKGVWRKK